MRSTTIAHSRPSPRWRRPLTGLYQQAPVTPARPRSRPSIRPARSSPARTPTTPCSAARSARSPTTASPPTAASTSPARPPRSGSLSPTGRRAPSYRLSGASWFGGNLNYVNGKYEFSDTEFFNILSPSGGVVAKVAASSTRARVAATSRSASASARRRRTERR
jgi:hypothetical protein